MTRALLFERVRQRGQKCARLLTWTWDRAKGCWTLADETVLRDNRCERARLARKVARRKDA